MYLGRLAINTDGVTNFFRGDIAIRPFPIVTPNERLLCEALKVLSDSYLYDFASLA